MQSHSTIHGWTFERLQSERLSSGGGLLLFVSATMVLLAFIPLTPPVDAIKGGGLTARGMIEFGLILAGILLMAGYARSKNLPWFDLRSPSFLLVSAFVFWAVVSSLWSVNPMLAIAKGLELWAVTISAAMFVKLSGRTHEPDRIERIMAWSLIAVLVIALFGNFIFWGKLLPSSGDDSLPLYLMGEEPPALAERPRLMLAYAHPLLTGDLLALAIVSLFVVPVNKLLKTTAIILLSMLLWMTDARGPTIALAVALIAMLVVKIRRASVKAIIFALVISIALGIALVFQDNLLKPFQALLTDDVYTLNSRTELWTSVFRHIAAQPIIGYGYYASRYLLMKDFIWGGQAHRVRIALDYFDASINRVAAWVIGTRNMLRALLLALLAPTERLKRFEREGDFTSRLAMMEEVSEQLGLAAESNRLYETSQRIAQREALVNEISTRLQSGTSVEMTLTSAARSLKDVLKANRVAIRLGKPPAETQNGVNS